MAERYGMVYMGSKEKILHLIRYIFEREYNKKTFVDLFCGGFSVSAYALQKTKFNVISNDLNKDVISLYNEIIFDSSVNFDKVKTMWISREKFEQVRDEPDNFPNWFRGFVLNIFSFGCNQKDYLYAKDLEEFKKAIHYALVLNDFSYMEKIDAFKELKIPNSVKDLEYTKNPYKRIEFMRYMKQYIKESNGTERQQHLERLEQMENIGQLEHLVNLRKNSSYSDRLSLNNRDYLDLYNELELTGQLENAFIYCDPPYENTKKYQEGQDFDYVKFWNWFRECPYPVYVSSYEAPDDIKPINYELKQVNLDNGKKGERETTKKKAVENLYWNGKGNYEPTLHDLLFNEEE